MMTLEEQREHYAAVRRRIAAAGRPEPEPKPKQTAVVLPFRIPPGITLHSDPIRITYPDLRKYHKAYIALLIDTATKHGLAPIDLLHAPSREFPIVRARHEMWAHMHAEWGWSYKQIGKVAERDRTTIIHGINKHNGVERAPRKDRRRA